MNNTHIVQDDGQFQKYFHIIPNCYDDDLGPYEYRLIGHYKRVGVSWEGTRKVAGKCQMSVAMVSKTRKTLVTKGLIRVEMLTRKELADRGLVSDKKPDDKTKICVVSVVDVTKQNVARYETQMLSLPVHLVNTPVHTMNTPVHQVNERIVLEEERLKNPLAPEKGADSEPPETPKKERKRNPEYDAIFSVWGYTESLNGAMAKMLKGTATDKKFKPGNITPALSPEDLQEWAAWYRHTELHDDTSMNMLEDHLKIQSSVTKWRQEKAAVISRPATHAVSSTNIEQSRALMRRATAHEGVKS